MKSRSREKNLKGRNINTIAYLALGANLGDREKILKDAVNKISEDKDCEILSASSIYETKSYGELNQSNFLNMALKISTTHSPMKLVTALQTIETALGRQKRVKWKEREIDIDILLFGSLVMNETGLKIPHYDLTNRDFFVTPLVEIDSEIVNPVDGKFLRELEFKHANRYILNKYSKSIEINSNARKKTT